MRDPPARQSCFTSDASCVAPLHLSMGALGWNAVLIDLLVQDRKTPHNTPRVKHVSYEADTKTLSCRCRLFLLFGQDLCTPIGQQWYQVIEKQNKSIGMSGRREHDQERVLVSASYQKSFVTGIVVFSKSGMFSVCSSIFDKPSLLSKLAVKMVKSGRIQSSKVGFVCLLVWGRSNLFGKQ